MVGVDRMAAGVDVDVAWGDPRCVPKTNASARSAAQGNWWCRTDCRHSASVTNEAAEPPQDLDPGENQHPGEDAGRNGHRRAFLSLAEGYWRGELERHQKKLNGPKNTAKHIEAKQTWINRETKRIESEVEKLAEMQEDIKARKENTERSVRGNRETPSGSGAGGRIDGQEQESCLVSGESVRNLELQDNACEGKSASKRMAGASRDATTEEIGSWFVEADRIALEISGKTEKSKTVENEITKDDIKMSDGGMDGSLSS